MLNILTHKQLRGARLSTANIVNLVDENLVFLLFCCRYGIERDDISVDGIGLVINPAMRIRKNPGRS